jgi:hypothetical protein
MKELLFLSSLYNKIELIILFKIAGRRFIDAENKTGLFHVCESGTIDYDYIIWQ